MLHQRGRETVLASNEILHVRCPPPEPEPEPECPATCANREEIENLLQRVEELERRIGDGK